MNVASRWRSSVPERTVITAVEINHANKSRSTTISMRAYTFVDTSPGHSKMMD